MAVKLNTTDYSILGLLARRPWSAYELAQYMQVSNIRAVWPRAQSRIYESPKKLAGLGLATVTTEQQGKRSRSVYDITDAGRGELAIWLEQDGRPFGFEYESLLKLALTDISDPVHRRLQLDSLEGQARQDWSQLSDWFDTFSRGEDQEIVPDRQVQNLLVNSFIRELLDARLRWSEHARELEARYADCDSEEDKAALVTAAYEKLKNRK